MIDDDRVAAGLHARRGGAGEGGRALYVAGPVTARGEVRSMAERVGQVDVQGAGVPLWAGGGGVVEPVVAGVARGRSLWFMEATRLATRQGDIPQVPTRRPASGADQSPLVFLHTYSM
jgi:hypothetical protein